MTNSEQCIAFVLANEGSAITNDPSDKGGVTHFGITLSFYRSCVGPSATADALSKMTAEQAAAFYKQYVYTPLGLNETDNIGVMYALVDCAVLCGQPHAVRTLQTCLGVTSDGKIGPVTLAAMRKAEPTDLRLKFCSAQIAYFRAIADRDATQRKYIYGWLCRAVRPLLLFC